MTSYILFESLESSNEEWAKKAASLLEIKRKSTDKELLKCGYNINFEANRLQELYEKIGAR